MGSRATLYVEGPSSFGLLFDIDGVLVRGKTLIPGAKECFRNLVDRNGKYKVPVVFVTNAGNCMRQTKAEHLSHLLQVEVSPDQVMLSHSPLRMFTQFKKKCVLVSGQGPVEEVAHNLGFENVVTIDMLREAYPVLDFVDHNRRPKDFIPPSKGLRPIDGMFSSNSQLIQTQFIGIFLSKLVKESLKNYITFYCSSIIIHIYFIQ
ncbi:Haloacid dehalogenase-like hydrolase domain-containing 5 [Goodea atripinnis]|uniref:Haloacid dehalogenase-like hydrolase domain-containing 5 n=1 Tax=Goodea atripinnis TaxID=208336 RepID=A0ABV0MWR8_9TELE